MKYTIMRSKKENVNLKIWKSMEMKLKDKIIYPEGAFLSAF